MKLTKLQRDALRLARWWADRGNDSSLLNNLSDAALVVFAKALNSIALEDDRYFDNLASAILSEVM